MLLSVPTVLLLSSVETDLMQGASQPKRNVACSVLIAYFDRIYTLELEQKYTTDTALSTSYLQLHTLMIGWERNLK